jgi:hypothetical protein
MKSVISKTKKSVIKPRDEENDFLRIASDICNQTLSQNTLTEIKPAAQGQKEKEKEERRKQICSL